MTQVRSRGRGEQSQGNEQETTGEGEEPERAKERAGLYTQGQQSAAKSVGERETNLDRGLILSGVKSKTMASTSKANGGK